MGYCIMSVSVQHLVSDSNMASVNVKPIGDSGLKLKPWVVV